MSLSVPLVDLKKNFLSIEGEIRASMERVLENTSFAMGPVMVEFEQAFAAYCGVKYCLGVSSGLEALSISLRCLGIGPGDEVILPANTFIATALAVSTLGATPVLVDVDPKTDLTTAELMAAAITPKTKALLPVHLYGRLVNIEPMQKLAQKHGLFLVEDSAQSHGAKLPVGKAGTFGQAGCFSFYPGKNLGAFGDGGAITTNDPELAEKIRLYRNYGSDKKYYHDSLGSNNRLDTLQAAVLLAKLKHLESWNALRLKAAELYQELLNNESSLETPELVLNGSHVYHLYPVRLPRGIDRDGLLKKLNGMGIGASIHYPVPVHLQKAYEHLPYKKGDFPVSEDHAERMISLPIFPEITPEQQRAVVDGLKTVLSENEP
jgi:dTDP-4-amino-4,6-dideoxygalactose transaminase